MRTIDLTLTNSNERITIIADKIKTIKDEKYNYGENFTIITFIDNDSISVNENINAVKKLLGNI